MSPVCGSLQSSTGCPRKALAESKTQAEFVKGEPWALSSTMLEPGTLTARRLPTVCYAGVSSFHFSLGTAPGFHFQSHAFLPLGPRIAGGMVPGWTESACQPAAIHQGVL